MASISDNLASLRNKISQKCEQIGRDPREITLIGVTKYADADSVLAAVEAGLKDIGENRVQEAQRKFPFLAQAGKTVRRHMIGHLQTNKVKDAIEHFDLIQSVDSLKLIDVIEAQAAKAQREVSILLQVNTSGEEQKYGIAPAGVDELLERIVALKHVRLLGLMAIAPLTEDKDIIRRCFADLRLIRDRINKDYQGNACIRMQYLSMGMSDDYQIALEEGANMIRIGRAIFGEQS